MLCPFCLGDTPSNSIQCVHTDCSQPLPAKYVELHRKDSALQPVILSVVGFRGHGKTVYLTSLFHLLENILPRIWAGFSPLALDQSTIDTLGENRRLLQQGVMPESTRKNFPKPSIHRLSAIPQIGDRTILIYDPPGEAFEVDEEMGKYAHFVKRSNCVLFLISLSNLDQPVGDGIFRLLNTYILGLSRLGAKTESQNLIIVYSKADEIIDRFGSPELINYLRREGVEALAKTKQYIKEMQNISRLLERFTVDTLDAQRFVSQAERSFKSVRYTAVSSLGSQPRDGALEVAVSPRRVIDPMLWVLSSKPAVIREDSTRSSSQDPTPLTQQAPSTLLAGNKRTLVIGGAAALAVLLITLAGYFFFASAKRQIISKVKQGQIVAPAGDSAYDIFLKSNLSENDLAEIRQEITPILEGKGKEVIKQIAVDGYNPAVADCENTARIYTWLDTLSSQNSYKARKHYFQGRAAFERNDLSGAENEFKQSINFEQSLAVSVNHMGRVYVRRKDYITARNWYQRAIDLDPKWMVPRINLCVMAIENLKDFPLGEQVCRGVLQLDQNKASGYYFLGRAIEGQRRQCDAFREYRTALEKAPSNPNPGFDVDKLNRHLNTLRNQCGY
jgi:hypothetical protein